MCEGIARAAGRAGDELPCLLHRALGHEPGTSPDDVLGSLGLSANQLQAELSGCR